MPRPGPLSGRGPGAERRSWHGGRASTRVRARAQCDHVGQDNIPLRRTRWASTTDEKRRVPLPPTTREQKERFAEAEEESEQEPVTQVRDAIHQAQSALREAEDALDQI
ncbi:MAG TPA: hypothetical protein VLA89_08455 [Gemmatimonadales bacterium]|nr:hypothetical protein [Gemmatimonadales bacterium]